VEYADEEFDAAVLLMMHHASESTGTRMEGQKRRRVCQTWASRILNIFDADTSGVLDSHEFA